MTALPSFSARHPDRLFIGGEWVRPAHDTTLVVRYPATGEAIAEVAAAGVEDAARAVAIARHAFDHGPWPRASAAERAAVLRRFADRVEARFADLAQAVTLEMGAPITVTRAQGAGPPALIRYHAELLGLLPDVERRIRPSGSAWTVHEAVGVVVAIVPWNAPLNLSVLKLAPALAAGCAIVLKSAPTTPLDAILLAECLDDVGLPEGVVSILPGDDAVGDALVRDPRVDKVTFTGSTAVGRRIGAICGERIARVALELGGKSAAILLDDMDMAEAAAKLIPGATLLSGQACAALTRVLVPRHRHDRFLEAFVAGLKAVKMGDPFDPATTLGPMSIERQRDRVEACIAQGRSEGARLVLGGGRPAGLDRGWYVEPTVFTDVDGTMSLAQHEIFGPVVSVMTYDGEDEAIAIANDSAYGLYTSVFTHDSDAYWRIARRARSGSVGLNGLYIDRTLPYGGFKQSGIGREGGVEGLRSFQEIKTIFES
ncbi:MAG: aldehyde dehydrogenase [Sphingomonas sp.]